MKSKDTDFPNLLLQQFNFRETEEVVTAEGSEAAKEKESEEDQQPEQKEVEDDEAEGLEEEEK